MSSSQYNLQFEKLCKYLQLGEIISEPVSISGGLLHKMFAVQTTQGKYAVKALNPQIMLRPRAMQDYINSEKISSIAVKNIPTVTAKIFNGTQIQVLDGQYYLVFEWIDGRSLRPNEINIVHCEKIGVILAELHKTDFSELGLIDDYSSVDKLTDWNFYLQKGLDCNAVWLDLLRENIDNLYFWNNRMIESARAFSENTVISHGDLDPKNVIWYNGSPYVIDWEAAGFIHPMHDLIETAIYWSKGVDGNIEKEKFMALMKGYKFRNNLIEVDWKTVLYKGFESKLGWLEYSLKRSLRIECTDEAEQRMGTEHVSGTIHEIVHYADMFMDLEKWLSYQK